MLRAPSAAKTTEPKAQPSSRCLANCKMAPTSQTKQMRSSASMSVGRGGGGGAASRDPPNDEDAFGGGGASRSSALEKPVRVLVCFICKTSALYAARSGTTGEPPTDAFARAASSWADVWSS